VDGSWRIPLRDSWLAGALVTIAMTTIWLTEPRPARPLVTTVIALVMTGSLAWRRRAPVAVLLTVLAAVLALGWVEHSVDAFYALLAPLAATYSIGTRLDWRRGLPWLAVTVAMLWWGLWLDPVRHELVDYPFAARPGSTRPESGGAARRAWSAGGSGSRAAAAAA
jgi:hypothetical protein